MAIHRKFTFPKGIKLKKEVVKNKQIQKKTDFRQKQFKTNETKEVKSAKTTGSTAIIILIIFVVVMIFLMETSKDTYTPSPTYNEPTYTSIWDFPTVAQRDNLTVTYEHVEKSYVVKFKNLNNCDMKLIDIEIVKGDKRVSFSANEIIPAFGSKTLYYPNKYSELGGYADSVLYIMEIKNC